MEDQSKKNPYISFKRLKSSSQPSSFDGETEIDPLAFATYEESLLGKLTTQLDAQMLSEIDHEIVLMLIDDLDEKGLPNGLQGHS